MQWKQGTAGTKVTNKSDRIVRVLQQAGSRPSRHSSLKIAALLTLGENMFCNGSLITQEYVQGCIMLYIQVF